MGYIKDYDGGTLMECAIHAALPYLGLPAMVAAQRAALDRRIRALSNAHVVHPGLPPGPRPVPIGDIPGGLLVPDELWRLQPLAVSGRRRALQCPRLCWTSGSVRHFVSWASVSTHSRRTRLTMSRHTCLGPHATVPGDCCRSVKICCWDDGFVVCARAAGVREAGWTPEAAGGPRVSLLLDRAPAPPTPANLRRFLGALLKQLQARLRGSGCAAQGVTTWD